MNKICVPNEQKRRKLEYELINGEIKPTTERGVIYNPWRCSSSILTLQVVPIDSSAKHDKNSIHLSFASCQTPQDCLTWVNKYGLPYLRTGHKWWEDIQCFENDETTLKVDELLMWVKIASWLLKIGDCYQNKKEPPTTPPEVEKIKILMGLETFPEHNIYRHLPQHLKDEYQILNKALACIGIHYSYNAQTQAPETSFDTKNLMQLIFLNIHAEKTADHNMPQHCACGKWFSVPKKNNKKYCSSECQIYYKQKRYRQSQNTPNVHSLSPRKLGRPRKQIQKKEGE